MKKYKTFVYNPNASFNFQSKDDLDAVKRWFAGDRQKGSAILLVHTGNPEYPTAIHIGFDFNED